MRVATKKRIKTDVVGGCSVNLIAPPTNPKRRKTMKTTDYCSYELSKKLKVCGFDEPCIAQWACEPDGKPMLVGSTAFVFSNAELKGRDVTAPLLFHAQKWLREKKKMHCQVLLNGVRSMYFWQVREMIGNGRYADSAHQYDVYEDAMSDCISAALELIKKGE